MPKITKNGNIISYGENVNAIDYKDYNRLAIIIPKYCLSCETFPHPQTFQNVVRLTISEESLIDMLNHVGEFPTNKRTDDSEKEKKINSLLDEIKNVTDI